MRYRRYSTYYQVCESAWSFYRYDKNYLSVNYGQYLNPNPPTPQEQLLAQAGLLIDRIKRSDMRSYLQAIQTCLQSAGYAFSTQCRHRVEWLSEDRQWRLERWKSGWNIRPHDDRGFLFLDRFDPEPSFPTRDEAVQWAAQQDSDALITAQDAVDRLNLPKFGPIL